MRSALSMFLGAAVLLVAGPVQAEEKDKKEVTLKGTIVCAKCKLKETEKCANAIEVKEGDKTVVYYFEDKGRGESYHEKICQTPAKGSVTGTVTEKDKKKYITPSKDGVKFE